MRASVSLVRSATLTARASPSAQPTLRCASTLASSRSSLSSLSSPSSTASGSVSASSSRRLGDRPLLSSRLGSTPPRSSPAPASTRSFFSLPDISKLAGLVPGQDNQGGVSSNGDEQRFHARKIMPYTPAQLYELVSDVPAYVNFIPFCTDSTVLQANGQPDSQWKPGREPFTVDAELAVGFGGLEERYISHVVGVPFEKVSATASKQTPLFKNLETIWSFKPTSTAASAPTLLSIDLVFAFANPLHRIASQAVLPKVAEKMVEAFEQRCLEVYGRR